MNGITKHMDIMGYNASLLSSSVVDMKLDDKNMMSITTIFSKNTTGTIDDTTLTPRFSPLATTVLIAMGSPSWVSDIMREYVGIMRLYKLTPSLPIDLVNAILMIKPSPLVISEPINKISELLKNKLFFFIVNYMKKRAYYFY